MPTLDHVVLDVADAAEAEAFYKSAFELDDLVRVREAQDPTSGYRGYTLSLIASQPGDVDSIVRSARDAGATELKPVSRSFWGYGGVVRAPDGAVWKVATSSRKDSGPVSRRVDEVALLIGVEDVKATKRFYGDHGFAVGKSFGSKYVEFDLPGSRLKLALYGRRALAKDAGVPEAGTGSHRITLAGDAGPLTDLDGFQWGRAR
jgi:uncharacterized glyoxalase superfamily protein PhnB